MIVTPIRSRSLFEGRRLDAKYFTSPGVRSAERLVVLAAAGVEMLQIGGPDGIGTVQHTTRFKRQLAAPAEESKPFLRAFDVFEYLPEPADLISVERTTEIDELLIEPGAILLTRSGRNLGPCVLADKYLARFVPSDDLLRIRIENEDHRHYVFAFLNTPTGQELLRLDRTGSVIDHLSAGQVSRQSVPVLPQVYDQVVTTTREASRLQGEARIVLSDAVTAITAALPSARPLSPLYAGWSINATALAGRFDAAFHQADVWDLRAALLAAGGRRIGDVAGVRKPAGRFKTYYVTEEHGRPMLSGRHLLQFKPIGAKHISNRSLKEGAIRYELRAGMIAFQADGRAEESLGQPVMVTAERDGWLASGHVGRIIPNSPGDAGWIWAAMASPAVRKQMSAAACGSVVDALYEPDIENVILPPRDLVDSAAVTQAWNEFEYSNRLVKTAAASFEAALHVEG